MASELAAITRLTPRVIRILGFNPSFVTLDGTNTYLIGNGTRRILLDTGEPNKPKYIDALKSVIQEENVNLAHIIITHWHNDHLGGLRTVYENFATDTTVWKFRRSDAKNEKNIDSVPLRYVYNGQEFNVDGATLRIVHTPGHTTDHIVLHFKEEDAVFAGDCILGKGTTVFEDLYDYMNSLKIILGLDAKVLYPGHGPVVEDVKNRIESYIRHREFREQQILQVVREREGELVASGLVVAILYKDVSESLHEAAEKNVINHMMKLEKDGLLKRVRDRVWTLA